MHKLPPLNALRTFEAAARHQNFTLAAAELCVTPGAVSRQINALEQYFGIRLFVRANRCVTLTEAGRRYFAAVAAPLAEIARAGTVLDHDHGGKVVVDCLPTLAMHWLMQRLPAFRLAHPDILVDVRTATGPVDTRQPFDLAVRRDPAHFAGLTATPLMTEWSVPVCSAEFARLHHLETLADLGRVPVLHIRARADLWPSWCRAKGMAPAALGPRQDVDHTFVAMQAAEDGLGVAMVPLIFAKRLLKAGRLSCPLSGAEAVTGTYSLLRPATPPTAEAEAFARWLAAECATAPPSES
ncbi:LysR substrate-binding domain-containing protein [Magnetospirillum aberrantis]|uniref:LysR family transcriptional regulator n=1 Tax=Magnetospirillum aberrantis SpK TaxID=908842 RepID=A0A7C9UZS6_9PROT|nr:LysR substrate-binding domain-containing protein [Magnetospirillum aberrantis]NFV80614.1 LysR family transcriptional regulator [Magnetospirillum aberrantis SpK]